MKAMQRCFGAYFVQIAVALLAFTISACAQQTDSSSSSAPAKPVQAGTPSGTTPSDGSQSKPAPSNADQPNKNQHPDLSSQPPVDSLSRDTTFPGDRPENNPPANSPSAPASHKPPDLTPPRSDRVSASDLPSGGSSSSKESSTDLSAPSDDAKLHPHSADAVAEAEAANGNGVSEFRVWDPHKAAKDVEVGDFYFKKKNYRAAEDRYREALHYKDNDAVATIRLAACLEKLKLPNDAVAEYESYLRILPHGPQAEDAEKAIARLKEGVAKANAQ